MLSITVKTLNGTILNFKTESFLLSDGMITFYDLKTGMKKIFPANSVNIDEVIE